MQNVHPTMAAFLAPFAPSYYTLHPDLDAARWEADQDARDERLKAEEAERIEDLKYSFLKSLEAGEPLPTRAIGADLETVICERLDLVAPILRWAAQHRTAYPELRDLLQPLAEAWAKEVEGLS